MAHAATNRRKTPHVQISHLLRFPPSSLATRIVHEYEELTHFCHVRQPPLGATITRMAGPLAGVAVEGLTGAALGGLGVAGAHPGRRKVGPGPSEPLFQFLDLGL